MRSPTRTKLYTSGLWECEGETPQEASGDDGTFECETQTFKVFAGGRLVAQIHRSGADDNVSYIHSDRMGSVWQVSDEDGEIIESREYEAFGDTVAPFDIAQITAGYTSHEHDPDVELINMRGRLYDPNQRRFLSPDPIVTSPTHAQSWNPFSYVMNDPFNMVDPSGYSGVEQSPWISIGTATDDGGVRIGPMPTPSRPDSEPGDAKSGAGSSTGTSSSSSRSSQSANVAGTQTVSAAAGTEAGSRSNGNLGDKRAGAVHAADEAGHAAGESGRGGMANVPPGSGQAAGTSMTGGSASGVGSGGNAGNASGGALDSGVGGISFGWAQVASIAFEVAVSSLPLGGAVLAMANGDIKGALIEAAIDIATGGTAGPAKAAVKGARIIAGAIDAARAAKKAKSANKLAPNLKAAGSHTSFKRGADGKVSGYETYNPSDPRNPNPWTSEKRVDVTGSSHYNKATGQDVPTPHVQGPGIPGGVRAAEPWEIP